MTLINRNRRNIEAGQSQTVSGAGGARLDGDFEWMMDGWVLTLRRLTFAELVRIVEAVRQIVE